ncbi:small polypeptide DEVIL 14 [Salvia miltiorrhiza]|nr:small polypeptide DEVIL 14 [Salvia miltiorrhiza]
MAAYSVFPSRSLKQRSVQRCSKQMREHKARLYIIWRCTVLLLCWHE